MFFTESPDTFFGAYCTYMYVHTAYILCYYTTCIRGCGIAISNYRDRVHSLNKFLYIRHGSLNSTKKDMYG